MGERGGGEGLRRGVVRLNEESRVVERCGRERFGGVVRNVVKREMVWWKKVMIGGEAWYRKVK